MGSYTNKLERRQAQRRKDVNDPNQPPVPQEKLLMGVFVSAQGMRINSPLPPRELLNLLLTVAEQVRESIYRTPVSPIVGAPAQPGLHT